MKIRTIASVAPLLGLAVCLIAVGPQRSTAQDESDGVEVLARGPVHEAYASPSDPQPRASALVPKEPPDPIEEEQPDQRPEGENVVWIPGYFAWDAEATDFLWVSGFWRDAPAGRHWMPGAWEKVGDEGWRWINGFWAPEEQEEVAYVPPPPETLEHGPSTPEPEVSSTYVPGCWIWRETRHVWRPGFWLAYRPGWVWVPAYYVWTPAGCIFVEGCWDHPLHDRGLLFAPVRIAPRLLVRGWTYRPHYVVQTDSLLGALFVRTAARQYCFGDYFGDRYQRAGFVPWLDYRPARNVYDVNFNYYRAENRRDRRWEESLRGLYAARQRGDVAPPPRTLVQQTNVVQKLTQQKTHNVTVNKTINLTNIQNVSVLAPLTKIDNTKVTLLAGLAQPSGTAVKEPESRKTVKLQKVNAEQQKQVKEQTAKLLEIGVQRKQAEEKARVKPGQKQGVVNLTLPKPAAPPRPKEAAPKRKAPPPLPPQIPRTEPKPKKDQPKPPKQPLPRVEQPKPPPPKVEQPKPPPPKVEQPKPPPPKEKPKPPPKKDPEKPPKEDRDGMKK